MLEFLRHATERLLLGRCGRSSCVDSGLVRRGAVGADAGFMTPRCFRKACVVVCPLCRRPTAPRSGAGGNVARVALPPGHAFMPRLIS